MKISKKCEKSNEWLAILEKCEISWKNFELKQIQNACEIIKKILIGHKMLKK